MAKACFAVRAEVPEAERSRFDHWYETDHLPWALRAFGARRAWRCWSRSDPAGKDPAAGRRFRSGLGRSRVAPPCDHGGRAGNHAVAPADTWPPLALAERRRPRRSFRSL